MDLIKEIAKRQKKFLNVDSEGTKENSMVLYYNRNYDDHYFFRIDDNLNQGMIKKHFDQYRDGSGGEIRPPKMACVYSSSAMAFNMLGNEIVTFIKNPHFAPGTYSITYEKKLKILKKYQGMSNIDAYLFDEDRKNAIFCEMKMKEWLAPSNEDLKEAYKKGKYYSNGAHDTFLKLIENLQKEKEQKSDFKDYDVWQMFKHTLAIFNAFAEKGELAGLGFKKVTLANVVYKIDEWTSTDESDFKKEFENKFEEERKGFNKFKDIVLDSGLGLKELFENECNVDFDIVFIPTHEFINCMEKTDTEKKYLERYWKF